MIKKILISLLSTALLTQVLTVSDFSSHTKQFNFLEKVELCEPEATFIREEEHQGFLTIKEYAEKRYNWTSEEIQEFNKAYDELPKSIALALDRDNFWVTLDGPSPHSDNGGRTLGKIYYNYSGLKDENQIIIWKLYNESINDTFLHEVGHYIDFKNKEKKNPIYSSSSLDFNKIWSVLKKNNYNLPTFNKDYLIEDVEELYAQFYQYYLQEPEELLKIQDFVLSKSGLEIDLIAFFKKAQENASRISFTYYFSYPLS